MWAHLGALLAGLVGFLAIVLGFLAFLVPLIIMNTAGTLSAHVRAHAVESLNFQLTGLIITIPALILVVLTVGLAAIPLLVLCIVAVVWMIQAAIAGSQGRTYRYPICIRLVK